MPSLPWSVTLIFLSYGRARYGLESKMEKKYLHHPSRWAAFRAWIEGTKGVYRFSQYLQIGLTRFGSPSHQKRTLASVDWGRPVAGYHCCPLDNGAVMATRRLNNSISIGIPFNTRWTNREELTDSSLKNTLNLALCYHWF